MSLIFLSSGIANNVQHNEHLDKRNKLISIRFSMSEAKPSPRAILRYWTQHFYMPRLLGGQKRMLCPAPNLCHWKALLYICAGSTGKSGWEAARFLLTILWWENVFPEAGCDMVLCFELLNTRGWAREGAWDGSRLDESFSMEDGVFPNRTARSILVESTQGLDE